VAPKSVTLNDLERRTGRYFALFCQIQQLWRPVTSSKWLKMDSYCVQQTYITKNMGF